MLARIDTARAGRYAAWVGFTLSTVTPKKHRSPTTCRGVRAQPAVATWSLLVALCLLVPHQLLAIEGFGKQFKQRRWRLSPKHGFTDVNDRYTVADLAKSQATALLGAVMEGPQIYTWRMPANYTPSESHLATANGRGMRRLNRTWKPVIASGVAGPEHERSTEIGYGAKVGDVAAKIWLRHAEEQTQLTGFDPALKVQMLLADELAHEQPPKQIPVAASAQATFAPGGLHQSVKYIGIGKRLRPQYTIASYLKHRKKHDTLGTFADDFAHLQRNSGKMMQAIVTRLVGAPEDFEFQLTGIGENFQVSNLNIHPNDYLAGTDYYFCGTSRSPHHITVAGWGRGSERAFTEDATAADDWSDNIIEPLNGLHIWIHPTIE